MTLVPQAVKNDAAGDLAVVIQDSGGTNADVTAHNATAANALHALIARAITAEEAVTTGNAGFLSLDPANGRLRVSVENSPAVTVTSGAITLAANSGVDVGDVDILSIAAGDNNIGNVDVVTLPNVTVDTGPAEAAGLFCRITDGSGGPVNVAANDAGVPGALLGVAAGIFEAAGGGGTAGRGGLLSLQDSDGALRVASSIAATGNPEHSTATSTAIAAAGTATLESADPGTSGTRYLRKAILSSTVQGKWELKTKEDGGAPSSVLATLYTSNVQPTAVWEAPWKEAVALTLAAGADSYQWVFTNLDAADAGDASANFFVES